MIRLNTVLTLVATAALTACTTLGPNYQAPAPNAPASYRAAASSAGAELQRDWWLVFGDAQLNALEAQALQASPTLAAAAARVAPAAPSEPDAFIEEPPELQPEPVAAEAEPAHVEAEPGAPAGLEADVPPGEAIDLPDFLNQEEPSPQPEPDATAPTPAPAEKEVPDLEPAPTQDPWMVSDGEVDFDVRSSD
ncbi:MAG: hypothetical protein IIA03_13220, partial [Proteobacteria bacterium]|nr:hypothetical protein [Pseudomonadota bacterium]